MIGLFLLPITASRYWRGELGHKGERDTTIAGIASGEGCAVEISGGVYDYAAIRK